ncbi:hypothetical protein VN97_g12412 [Penicillium thymicola]|uniref:Uncharacterized protein n=1 Tax=Penicillium thymicola TaxID=293382 RepID=A0AAI9X2H3_PENTH|nr:hypothetical protein VN97_g12412 [Penicillium thymicola]
MFEDFSFTSPSSRPPRLALDPDDRLMVDSDSNLISPLSSRCPSPQSQRFRNISRSRSSHYHRNQQPPTSVPFPYDSDHKRLSISTLTQKLHEHTLTTPPTGDIQPRNGRHTNTPGSRRYPGTGYVLTPPDTDHSDDSGVGECLSSPSASSTTSPTFMPPDLLSDLPDFGLEHPFYPQPHPYHQDVRMQREQISRLQCNESEVEAMQRSLLDEPPSTPDLCDEDDCHPSSLPPRSSPRRRAVTLARSRFGPEGSGEGRARRKSSSAGVLASRVEKSHYGGFGKRNEQGLRRKSLVSAALASMVEREDEREDY